MVEVAWVPLAEAGARIAVAVVREPLLAYLRGSLASGTPASKTPALRSSGPRIRGELIMKAEFGLAVNQDRDDRRNPARNHDADEPVESLIDNLEASLHLIEA